MKAGWDGVLNKRGDCLWEIPQDYKQGMRTSGLIYASEAMISDIVRDQAPEQVANVAFLPGIVGNSLAMPDIHWGYGFPIGGVAATRVDDGVISPGGVGFDINCGVRLLRTNLTEKEIKPKIGELMAEMFRQVPSGVGSEGKIKLNDKEINKVLRNGARWAVEMGYGEESDIEYSEENGCMKSADPGEVSQRAKKRGLPQLGTLGSGNHFLEIQVVDQIYDTEKARVFGIEYSGQIFILIHTGSRGLGYQVCDDSLKDMMAAVQRYGIDLPDRQLACAPVTSPEGKAYLGAMACAANYAWANRQCITHWTRQALATILGRKDVKASLVYDVAHNIAKIERHKVEGKDLKLCVHRKGATRAFPAGHPDIPAKYRGTGQPVLIPGDMGRYSFVAVGTDMALEHTFGSTCHGAGRLMSRSAAKKQLKGTDIPASMQSRGITVMAHNLRTIAEEAPQVYKDVSEVVDAAQCAGISQAVARMRPIGVIKG